MRRRCLLAAFACLPLLTSCLNAMNVQKSYVADRDGCRTRSESAGAIYSEANPSAMTGRERNIALLQLFCECMKEKEWRVTGCPKPPAAPAVAAVAPPPTVVVVQSPSAQPVVLPAPPAPAPTTIYEPMPVPTPAAPAPQATKKKAKKKKIVCTPPQTCPAPATATAPRTPAQENQQLKEILQRQ